MSLHDISQRLSAIADEIDDIALAKLRDAVDEGATKPSDDDKRLARARRSVMKAADILSEME